MTTANVSATKGQTIDINSILNSNPDSVGGVIVAGSKAVVFLRRDFIEQFDENDGIEVAGESLHEDWGRKGTPSLTAAGDAERKGAPNDIVKCKLVDDDEKDNVLAEIEAAKAFIAGGGEPIDLTVDLA